jgi:hypothetical protein
MLLQCSNGDLQFALWYGIAMLHWWRANCSVHVALCITAVQQWWFTICAVQVTCQCTALQHFKFVLWKLYFAAFLCPSVTFFEKEICKNFLSPFRRIQSFRTVQECGGDIIDILEDSPLKRQGTELKTTQFLKIH